MTDWAITVRQALIACAKFSLIFVLKFLTHNCEIQIQIQIPVQSRHYTEYFSQTSRFKPEILQTTLYHIYGQAAVFFLLYVLYIFTAHTVCRAVLITLNL
jgi:hypothetical protein